MTIPEAQHHRSEIDSDRVGRLFASWARDSARGLSSLSPAMAGAAHPVSPQLARSAQATENAWRTIEEEFGLLTSTEAAQQMGYGGNRTWASTQRRAGKLLGIQRGGGFRYPGFQLDPHVMPLIGELIALARHHGWSDESLVLWLCSPSAWMLEDRRPVEFLGERPETVRAAAASAMAPQW